MSVAGQKKIAVVIIAIFFVGLDRFLKMLVLEKINEPVYMLGKFFSFQFAGNYGIAFSLLVSGILLNILIGAIIIMLLAAIFRSWPDRRNDFQRLAALLLISAGAMSNYYDRLCFGYVIDYFDLRYFTVFNVADIMIVGGAVYLFLRLVYNKNTA